MPFKQCSDPQQFTSCVKYWLNGCLLAQFPSFGVCHVIPLPTSLHRCSVPAIWLVIFFCLCWSSPGCFFCVPTLALLATLFQLILPCLVCCEERNCVWLLVIIALCVFLCFFLFVLFVYCYSNLATVKGFKHPAQDPIVCTCRVLCASTVFVGGICGILFLGFRALILK